MNMIQNKTTLVVSRGINVHLLSKKRREYLKVWYVYYLCFFKIHIFLNNYIFSYNAHMMNQFEQHFVT